MGEASIPTADASTRPGRPSARHLPTWRELHPEDDPAVEALQFAGWRAAPSWKLNQLHGLLRLGLQLATQGQLLLHPAASAEQLKIGLAERFAMSSTEAARWVERSPGIPMPPEAPDPAAT